MIVNILGAGYVGLTLGIFIANQGDKVNIIDNDKSKIDQLKSGVSSVHEEGIQEALDFAIKSKNINFTTDNEIKSSIWVIAISYFPGRPEEFIDVIKNIKYDPEFIPTIMIRTTIPGGFIKEKIIPSLEEHFEGKLDQKFHIVSAPERSLSGNAINELRDLPQIIGGSETSTKKASEAFNCFGIDVICLPSYESAELVKSFTNFSRLVQFNLSNYLGALCSIHGVNEELLLNAIKDKYPRMDFLDVSGPGVGGFCLPKDALVMYDSLSENKKLIEGFPEIADFPLFQYKLNEQIIKFNSDKILSQIENGSKILALGIAFKGYPHTDDTRDSVGLKIINYLIDQQIDVEVFDLSVSEKKIKSLGYQYNNLESLKDIDGILFLNNDRRYTDLIKRCHVKDSIKKEYFIYDPWKIFLKNDRLVLEKSVDLDEQKK